MKNYAEEYYYMIPVGVNHPLLNTIFRDDKSLLYKKHALDENHLIKFFIGDPIPRKYKLADMHSDAQHLVISDRLKEAMQAMRLKDVQYLPATIKHPKTEEVFEGYWALHIHNMINCLDLKKSKFDTLYGKNDNIVSIEKLVFDNEALDKIPLEERLVFALGEERLEMFFHATVVEKIIDLKPVGLMFFPLAKWSDEIPFKLAAMEYIIEPKDK